MDLMSTRSVLRELYHHFFELNGELDPRNPVSFVAKKPGIGDVHRALFAFTAREYRDMNIAAYGVSLNDYRDLTPEEAFVLRELAMKVNSKEDKTNQELTKLASELGDD